MRLTLWLILLSACAHQSAWATRDCPNGTEVRVLRPVVSNAALNRYLLEQRVKVECERR